MTTAVQTLPMPPIAIEPWEWVELSAILREHLPNHPVWAFGSRATGQRVRRFSDLDLVVGGDTALPLAQRAVLHEAFDESRLPFKVDLTDLPSLAPEFRARIAAEMILVYGPAGDSEKTA